MVFLSISLMVEICYFFYFFFFNDTATTEIYTLSLHDALPISPWTPSMPSSIPASVTRSTIARTARRDRKSTRLNSSLVENSYAVFCLKNKNLSHSHATQMLAVGVHPKIASERLGHAKVGTTLDLYSHVLPGMQAAAAARVDVAIR